MRDTTLCLLIKEDNGQIAEVLLAMKKRSFGAGWWNGVGGKVHEGETIEQAAAREAKEEIAVEVGELDKRAEIHFAFPDGSHDQLMHVYFVRQWQGEPQESEEMKPEWFKVEDIPYQQMWPDDIIWMPLVYKNNLVKGNFTFDEGHKMVDGDAWPVEKL